ncbi:hypothetical protein EV191_101236 [Tamaricihabitans halophyticus]|uniref:Uncharacterized protein n=1 Tax=Tamaricihabitans halophyticus TaxID=1262583 RepID=A0A4R2RA58_9PSEU|nr:hypothetical protein EV191_101236 [Tamaricihabitans halophyticus]
MRGFLDTKPTGAVMVGRPPRPTRYGNDWAHWVPDDVMSLCGVRCTPADPKYLRTLQACPQCDRHERGFWHRATTPAGLSGSPTPLRPAGLHHELVGKVAA